LGKNNPAFFECTLKIKVPEGKYCSDALGQAFWFPKEPFSQVMLLKI